MLLLINLYNLGLYLRKKFVLKSYKIYMWKKVMPDFVPKSF